LTNIYCEVV